MSSFFVLHHPCAWSFTTEEKIDPCPKGFTITKEKQGRSPGGGAGGLCQGRQGSNAIRHMFLGFVAVVQKNLQCHRLQEMVGSKDNLGEKGGDIPTLRRN